MPYTAEVMEPGELSVSLIPETPQSVLDEIKVEDYGFAMLVVGSSETADDPTDANVLQDARFAAIYHEQSADRLTLGGPGFPAWMGDENDGGDMYTEASGTTASQTMEAQVSARVEAFANGLDFASYGPMPATTKTLDYAPGTSRFQFFQTILGLYPGGPYEWKPVLGDPIAADILIKYGRRGSLWPTTNKPTVILARNGGYGVTTGSAKYLSVDGTGDYASTPDTAALDIAGDLDLRIRVRASDYTTGNLEILLSKWNTTGNQRSYMFEIDSTGEMQLQWSNDGTTINTSTASGSSLTDGSDYWLRVTLDVNDGGGNKVVTFYKSSDTTNAHEDVTWTTVDTNTTAGTTSVFSGTSAARIASSVNSAGTSEFAGRVYAAAILDGIGDAGTVVADPVFAEWSPGDSAVADDAGLTWTLNGNAVILGTESATITGLPAILELDSVDVSGYLSEVVVGDSDTAVVGSATNTGRSTWLNLDADAPVVRSYIAKQPRTDFEDHPRRWSFRVAGLKFATWLITSVSAATQFATRVANATNSYASTITATIEVPDVGRFIECGDTVYVWDHRLGISDTSNEVEYRGEPSHPQKQRVDRMEVPISRGMPVWLRIVEDVAGIAVPRFVNLTRWIAWEEGPARIELGTRRPLHRPNARGKPINKKGLRAWARQHVRLARFYGTSV